MSQSGRRYHVAVVGLGSRGYKTWVKSLQACSSITISAVCDTNTATVALFTSRHPDIPAYCSLESLLQAHKPDFVILSVPNKHHSRCIEQLFAAGVPVLKEKPAAASLEEFQQLCQGPTKVGVAFQRRWQPRYVHFRRLLPVVGRVLSVKATLAGKYDPAEDGWRVTDCVGTFQDLGVHMLDVIIWLFGRPSHLLGHRADDGPLHHRDRESHVAMRWDMSNLVGQLYVSEVAHEKQETLSVRGVSGTLFLRCNEIIHLDTSGRQTFQMTIQPCKEETIETMCQDFGDYVSCISGSFSTSIAQMADTIATATAVAISFRSNKLEQVWPIHVPIFGRLPAVKVNGQDKRNGETDKRETNGQSHNGQQEDSSLPLSFDLNMSRRKFMLNTGTEIPALGFGTRKPKKPRQTYEAVSKALAVGYRHIDTAFRYNNEDQVGDAVRDSGIPREAIWITTKIDNTWHHRVAESFNASLKALGMKYIDLLLMHWPSSVSPEDPNLAMPDWDFTKTWQGPEPQDMQLLVQSGRVRNIGVSNFGIRNLQKLLSNPACSIVPAVNQIELHPLCPSTGLVKFCKDHGIHCTAYSPLASGLGELQENKVLRDICLRRSKSPQQLLLMWGLQRGTSVIPKSVNFERIAANYDLDRWALTAEEHCLLSNLKTRRRVYPDDWLPERVFWEEDD